jgi:hypothetical protein
VGEMIASMIAPTIVTTTKEPILAISILAEKFWTNSDQTQKL